MAIGSKRFEICATETAPCVSSKTRDKEKQTIHKEGHDPSNLNSSKRTSSLAVKCRSDSCWLPLVSKKEADYGMAA